MQDGGTEARLRRAEGPSYLALLGALHERRAPALYLEIGARSGASLALARGDFVAVDPAFRLRRFAFPGREAHFFQGTSDAFFASGLLERLGRRPDFAFLDGMHRFEFLLRDFINAEARMAPEGAIALHDCFPPDPAMTGRERRRRTRDWAGDVWKVPPILKALRPDLRIEVFDAAPTGLALVSGLDPSSRALPLAYERLVADLMPATLESYGIADFNELFDWRSTAGFLAGR